MEESVRLARIGGDVWGLSWFISGLGMVRLMTRDVLAAEPLFLEALGVARDYSNAPAVVASLAGLGGAALACAPCRAHMPPDAVRAARLLGAVSRQHELNTIRPWPLAAPTLARLIESVRETLTEEEFAREYAFGRGMSLEQAVAYGLEVAEPKPDRVREAAA